ncbi:regulatory protein, tetR family [Paramicrobacterium humi]|uniref:Regulatory protein, tetR family n=1 Tax=Paramicrobacterium humi TaxID=640635 RepID=A0A1H4MBR0_9MICO|nr:TetR/AcrR family transcriptional regulator [Microbacterium humi]SEB80540.1 regulatory protein, tetR family [Microbacterium humi]
MSHTSPVEAASSRRQKTRERLLDAAYEVFAEIGVDAAPVELITERAGFTRGAFYSNFESKNELFVALAERENAQRLAQLQVGLDTVTPTTGGNLSSMSTATRLEAVSELVAQFLKLQGDDRTWCLIEAEFRIQALRNPEFGSYLMQHRSAMEEQLAAVVSAALANFGQRFIVDPIVAVRLLISAYQSTTERSVLLGSTTPTASDPDLHKVIASIVTLFTEPIPD